MTDKRKGNKYYYSDSPYPYGSYDYSKYSSYASRPVKKNAPTRPTNDNRKGGPSGPPRKYSPYPSDDKIDKQRLYSFSITGLLNKLMNADKSRVNCPPTSQKHIYCPPKLGPQPPYRRPFNVPQPTVVKVPVFNPRFLPVFGPPLPPPPPPPPPPQFGQPQNAFFGGGNRCRPCCNYQNPDPCCQPTSQQFCADSFMTPSFSASPQPMYNNCNFYQTCQPDSSPSNTRKKGNEEDDCTQTVPVKQVREPRETKVTESYSENSSRNKTKYSGSYSDAHTSGR